MWRSILEIWIAWGVVALVACGLLYTSAAWIAGRIDERTIRRIVLWSRIGLSVTFLYSGVVKLTNPWYVLGTSIVEFKVGITETSALLRPLSVAIPWAEVAIAILLLFPIRWVVLSTGAILMAFLGLGVASAMRGMQVTCGCWGGTMMVGPLWFGEHGGMFLMAIAADHVFATRLLSRSRPVLANVTGD
ncbi:MAG TPA: MauE/DoxX family redox-associated membrane protein [Bryobacteraceae bacterium]|nr:MauE/DoxX family redox-associated membrane protein [Bryobacteraceae bacterium]